MTANEGEPEDISQLSNEALWDRIGYHKVIGGWWFGLMFLLVNMFTGVFLTTFMISYFYKYPSSMAYVSTVNTLFALMIFTFDIGTAGIMNRFIPEARISDPRKMIYYIRYFIWYQSITGLVQMTAVMVYCFYFASEGEMAYLVWIMLIISWRQYPGMLGVFHGLLDTLQYYDRAKIIDFTQGEIIQRLTELLFVWLGMQWGEANPQYGVIMGIAIGQAVGTYVDDFIGMAIGAHYFKGVIEKEGIPMIQCFIPHVPWETIKEVLVFAVKTSLPGFTANAVNLYVFTLYIANVPQWIIFGVFLGMAGGITSDMGYANLPTGSLYNEAFMNGKKVLSQVVLMKTYRFAGQVLGFFFAVFIAVLVILPDAFDAFRLDYYTPSLVFIVPVLIRNAINIVLGQSGPILYATNKPNLILIYGYVGQVTSVIYHTALVLWFHVHELSGGYLFLLVFAPSLLGWIISITQHVYIHYRLFPIKVAWWQTVVVPAVTSLICMGISLFTFTYIFTPLYQQVNFFFGLVIFMVVMLFVALLVYFPLLGLFGGWDDSALKEFEMVYKISGPSKPIIKPMFTLLKKACRASPLHNRFSLDDAAALEEARELFEMKEKNKGQLEQI